MGDIALLNANGTVNTEHFLPGEGEVLNKPKGMVLSGDRLWVTDIDSVWVFDTTTKQGVKITPTGAQFLNDVALIGDVLYVADTQANAVYAIEPADFISAPPQVTTAAAAENLMPNGLAIDLDGELLIGTSPTEPTDAPEGLVYKLDGQGNLTAVTGVLGQVDGLAVLPDGAILYTDWMTGTLNVQTVDGQIVVLASDIQGPADFGLKPTDTNGFIVAAPDIVAGQLRLITIEP